MLDKFGQELKLGDKVIIQAQVVALYPRESCINVKVLLREPRPTSDGGQHHDAFSIHSKTVIRRNP